MPLIKIITTKFLNNLKLITEHHNLYIFYKDTIIFKKKHNNIKKYNYIRIIKEIKTIIFDTK